MPTYTITDCLLGIDYPNVEALEKISLDEFSKYYESEMGQRWNEYQENNKKLPYCEVCKHNVTNHLNMARYFGRTTHLSCFSQIRNKKSENSNDKKLFDLVEKIKDNKQKNYSNSSDSNTTDI